MITRDALGRRIREVRSRHRMTLKDVENRSGLSSTHISEIERGRTSPTVGALIRLAHALNRAPSYFIEERELDEFCVTEEQERPLDLIPQEVSVTGGVIASLTRGVVSGRIRAYELRLDPGGCAELGWLRGEDDVCLYCVEGKLRLEIAELRGLLSAGFSVHGPIADRPRIWADAQAAARVILVVDPVGARC